ncbi:STAS domain-containing protein [Planomicrobium sp. CPCC 101110]|uniref:STAS domain-containing protein n=1 Tax=Planomicrobium sp. CPCC 101110 TaxID=2599619 RepID=UPI0011B476D6|nr:STAS domain-containing protein [Planomicrobium sp. CPCC 101110]TWT27346.1 STAS domain-containing protein [Planomicrobium sp. CPCC 101110]
MEREVVLLGERVAQDKYLLAELIHEEAVKDLGTAELKNNEQLMEVVIKTRAGFIELLGKSMQNYLKQEAFDQISQWGEATGKYFLEQGMSLESALAETSVYRKHIGKVIKTEALHRKMSVENIFEGMEVFHSFLDHAVSSYSTAYIKAYQENLAAARKEFLELSAPVVPLNDSIAVLPIIGELDTDRASYMLEKTLMAASQLRITTLIIDLSGVVKVDSIVAQQIIQIVQSLKLVGVRAILTGIRPEIALTLTQLGVDINSLDIGGSLKQAVQKLNVSH